MADSPLELTVRVFPSFAEARPTFEAMPVPEDAPFLRPEWLAAFENTGCVSEEAGWIPHHIAAEVGGEPLLAAPCYIKLHSQGEFVFDHGWANAAHRARIRYYPKLVFAVPFTPANGPRWLLPEAGRAELARASFAMIQASLCEQLGLSSSHTLFLPESDARALGKHQLAHRAGIQLHWENQGFEDFEGFLRSLPQKRRTQIRRERRGLSDQGVVLSSHAGCDLESAEIDHVYECYLATVDKFSWGRRYLNRAFFEEVCSTMGDSIDVVFARDGGGKVLAAAFNLRGKSALFGRYWGAKVEVPFLHFGVCYYHPIEHAIRQGLRLFEAGAGGEHKGPRGFLPKLTHSVHHLADPRLRRAVLDFCEEERALIEQEVGALPTVSDEQDG